MFKEKLVHLDLKGAPPRVEYLISLFPFFRKWGATGLCIEWEDMLPFSGVLSPVRSACAYSPADVARILKAAAAARLSVLPLVQTFGHLEMLLKHGRFLEMSEAPENPQDLCPSHPGSLPVILELVRQTLALHPGVKWIHLGGDEVWSLGSCPKCAALAKKSGKQALYLKHILPILEYVRGKGVRAMIWDDMLRHWPAKDLRKIGQYAEPVVWRYGTDIESGLPKDLWQRFGKNLPRLWAASAFKGADGPDIIWPDTGARVRNHERWLERSRKTFFDGIILTGWSRYNHCYPLCETLPAGTPALAMCLALLKRGGFSERLRKKAYGALGLGDFPFCHSCTEDIISIKKGNFPGADAFRLIGKMQGARQLLVHAAAESRGYFPRWNGGRINIRRLKVVLERCRRAAKIAGEVERELLLPLGKIMFPADVREFIGTKVRPVRAESDKIAREAAAILKKCRP